MRILTIMVVLACVAWQASALARPQEESEGRAPPRGLLKRGPLAKGKTTTTTPPPQEEPEYEDEAEYAEGEAAEPSTEAPVSSTEGKKLVGGGVRPFRSNTDLLEALKRRRAQAAEAKLHGHSNANVATSAPAQEPTDAPVKASYSKKRYNNAPKETNNEEAPAAAKPSRARFGRPSPRLIQEAESEDQQNESAPPARAARTFARRGN